MRAFRKCPGLASVGRSVIGTAAMLTLWLIVGCGESKSPEASTSSPDAIPAATNEAPAPTSRSPYPDYIVSSFGESKNGAIATRVTVSLREQAERVLARTKHLLVPQQLPNR